MFLLPELNEFFYKREYFIFPDSPTLSQFSSILHISKLPSKEEGFNLKRNCQTAVNLLEDEVSPRDDL